jgi:hypothetical protein
MAWSCRFRQPSSLFSRGDRVVLQVIYRGSFPELYLYPGDLARLCRELVIERDR